MFIKYNIYNMYRIEKKKFTFFFAGQGGFSEGPGIHIPKAAPQIIRETPPTQKFCWIYAVWL